MVISPNRRLEAIRAMLKIEKKDFITLLKTKRPTYIAVEYDRKPIPSNWLNILYDEYKVNPEWILLQKGEIFC